MYYSEVGYTIIIIVLSCHHSYSVDKNTTSLLFYFIQYTYCKIIKIMLCYKYINNYLKKYIRGVARK